MAIGTQEPGGDTIAVGVVFGPWDPFTRARRLAVTVASELPIAVTDEHASLLLRTRLITDREQLRRPDTWPRPVKAKATVEIEGTGVDLDVLRSPDRWLGQGVWRGFVVEIDAIAIEPGDVCLRVANDIPDR